MSNKNLYHKLNLNKLFRQLFRLLNQAVPYVLIVYFICFRSYFLSQQFLLQSKAIATASYFDVSAVGKDVAKTFAKIVYQKENHKDLSAKKRAVLSFGGDYKFLQFEVLFGIFLFFTFVFFATQNQTISFLSFFYRNRAPPLFC